MNILSFPKLTPKQKRLDKILAFNYISKLEAVS